jgi:hypothetical protein
MDVLKLWLCPLLFLMSTILKSQTINSFESLSIDRPDVSNLPTTVRPGHFQFEVGLEFGKNDFVKEYSLPNFLLRTGLGKKLELRLGVSHLQLDSNESVSSDAFVVNSVSFKYRFLEEKGIRPAIALQPEVIFWIPRRPRREKSKCRLRPDPSFQQHPS